MTASPGYDEPGRSRRIATLIDSTVGSICSLEEEYRKWECFCCNIQKFCGRNDNRYRDFFRLHTMDSTEPQLVLSTSFRSDQQVPWTTTGLFEIFNIELGWTLSSSTCVEMNLAWNGGYNCQEVLHLVISKTRDQRIFDIKSAAVPSLVRLLKFWVWEAWRLWSALCTILLDLKWIRRPRFGFGWVSITLFVVLITPRFRRSGCRYILFRVH